MGSEKRGVRTVYIPKMPSLQTLLRYWYFSRGMFAVS
jgi:hypothetical protein